MFTSLFPITYLGQYSTYSECDIYMTEMVFDATFNTILVISWRSVLLVKETGVPGENQRQTFTNKTDRHDITKIVLKVASNTISVI
jgi:hypothetical protein